MDTRSLEPEIQFTAARSRGPGGQNVNKVSSACLLRWDFMLSEKLTVRQKNQIQEKLYNQINKQGLLYLRSDEFRDFERNRSRCLEKLGLLLRKAFHVKKKRKKTKPTRASQEKRMDSKRRRGEVKKLRRRPTND